MRVRGLQVLGQEPAGLVALLEEACALCDHCLPRGNAGESGFKAFMKRSLHFIQSRCDKKLAAFETMHMRLSQAVADLSFVVQVHQFELVKHTQQEAHQQRCAALRHMLHVEEWQRRLERDLEVDRVRQLQALEQLQQSLACVHEEVRAGRQTLDEVRSDVRAERHAVDNMHADVREVLVQLQEERVQQRHDRDLLAEVKQLLQVAFDAHHARFAGAAACDPGAAEASTASSAAPPTALPPEHVEDLRIPPGLVRPWSVLLNEDGSEPLRCGGDNLLGVGGFGMVFKALQRCADGSCVPVAVKMLNTATLSEAEVQQFSQEVSIQVHCAGHPNVLGVRAAVVEREQGRYALVMDRCLADLGAVVHGSMEVRPALEAAWRWSRLPLRARLRKLLGLVSAVAFVHSLGVCHSDLKPTNVLVDRERGELMLTDFGLSRTVSTVSRLTSTGQVSRVAVAVTEELAAAGKARPRVDAGAGGTIPYMAPEQLEAVTRARPQSDVYSLGVLLFEVLERVSMPAMTREEALSKKLDTSDLEAAAAREGLPRLVPLLQRCWARNRHERPSARDVHAELTAMLIETPAAGVARPVTPPRVGPSAIHDVSLPGSGVLSERSAPGIRSESSGPASRRWPNTPVERQVDEYLRSTPQAEWTLGGLLQSAGLRELEGRAREELELEEVSHVLELEVETVAGVLGLKLRKRSGWAAMREGVQRHLELV